MDNMRNMFVGGEARKHHLVVTQIDEPEHEPNMGPLNV